MCSNHCKSHLICQSHTHVFFMLPGERENDVVKTASCPSEKFSSYQAAALIAEGTFTIQLLVQTQVGQSLVCMVNWHVEHVLQLILN